MSSSNIPAIFEVFKEEENIDHFQAGQVIFEQGQAGEVMYYILEGEVEIIFNRERINCHGTGEIFGEMALIDTNIRSASAIAKTDCQLISINERKFILLTQKHPFFALYIMRTLADRLRKQTAETFLDI